jgi:serine/threonine protein kinase
LSSLDRVSRAAGIRDNFSGRVIRIHGNSYTFQRKLGEGGFGNIKEIIFYRLIVIYKKKPLGVVYSARAPNHVDVAIKVIDLNRVPGAGPTLVQSYLNEVKHLEKLRRVSNHVVVIHDFDFDPRSGRGQFHILEIPIYDLFYLLRLYCYGIRWGEFSNIN